MVAKFHLPILEATCVKNQQPVYAAEKNCLRNACSQPTWISVAGETQSFQ